MPNYRKPAEEREQQQRSFVICRGGALLLAALTALGAVGCQTASTTTGSFAEVQAQQATNSTKSGSLVLHEGDRVRISFPGAPTLNAEPVIQRDGRISLALVGQVEAAGKTATQLEQELLKLYEPQLQTKEVTVAVEASALAVYVTGAVLRPGRITSDRPITALQAIMEAGIDYTKANLKAVRVIRNEDGKTEHHTLNLKRVLQGTSGDQFMLKPADIVYVPERFTWF